MAEIIRMPKLGFDMQEGLLVRWVKMEGDAIQKGDVLAEIETDKATVEVEAHGSGKIYKHLVEVNTSVPIGDPIAVTAEEGEEVDLDSLLGDTSEKGTEETDDQPTEETVHPKEESPREQKEEKTAQPVETQKSDEDRIKASPLAKKMAEDNDLDLGDLTGSGPGGRIVKKDIEAALAAEKTVEPKSQTQPAQTQAPGEPEAEPLPEAVWQADFKSPADNTVPMSKLRQAIGRRMQESKQQLPHFYVTSSVDVGELMRLYKQVNDSLPKEQKISVNDYVIKAAAFALRSFPAMNASIKDNSIVQHGAVNIGVAVAVEGGLLTVVVRDADVKPMRVISDEVKQMAARVRSGKIKPEDVEGSTFSISNMGMFDVENFAAIINPPEAAILAVSSAQQVPVVVDDQVKIGWRMKVTLSADHRVTDGVEAAKFMQILSKHLESPLRLLL